MGPRRFRDSYQSTLGPHDGLPGGISLRFGETWSGRNSQFEKAPSVAGVPGVGGSGRIRRISLGLRYHVFDIPPAFLLGRIDAFEVPGWTHFDFSYRHGVDLPVCQ